MDRGSSPPRRSSYRIITRNWAAAGAPYEAPGLFAWAYLRVGIEATLSDCTLGLSGALEAPLWEGPSASQAPAPWASSELALALIPPRPGIHGDGRDRGP